MNPYDRIVELRGRTGQMAENGDRGRGALEARPALRYGLAVAAVGLSALGGELIDRAASAPFALLYVPALVLTAFAGGAGPAILATVLGLAAILLQAPA